MNLEHIKIKEKLEEIKILDFLKSADKLNLVSFISQFPLPIALLDKNARFLGVNQDFSDIYESDALYLLDKLLNGFSTVVYAQFQTAVQLFENKENHFEQEFYSKGKFYLSFFKAIRNADQELDGILLVCADVTKLKRRENILLQNNKKLHDHLYLDTITGLQNKLALDLYLSEKFKGNYLNLLSFLKIDLDDFKKFNQSNSYTKGDEVLAQLGAVLNETIMGMEAKIFRLNSASFVVVIEEITEWAVITLAERIKMTITHENIKFQKDLPEQLTASIGIVTLSEQVYETNFDVLQCLEQAVKSAKSMGKNSLFVFKHT